MIRSLTTRLVVGLLAAGATPIVSAQSVTFELLTPVAPDDLAPLAVSADGSVIAGNSLFAFNYETFRWTEAGGVELLGGATAPVLGVGAGTPDISNDGSRISATVLNATSEFATIGVWTEGQGWTTAEIPENYPEDCAPLDNSIGSAWGLSGDGETVVGLYWRGGVVGGGSAHATAGPIEALKDLGSLGSNRSSRANAASDDGLVVGGWSERPDGLWQPIVWVDGELTQLGDFDVFCSVDGVRGDGLTVVGCGKAPGSFTVGDAYRWDFDGKVWTPTVLGTLPGTFQPFGLATARSITADGSTIVGYNRFGIGNETGFVWTEQDGMRSIEDYLADNGVSVPADLLLLDVTAISDDGSTMVGVALDTTLGRYRGYRILISSPCPADLNGDGEVGGADLSIMLAAWGPSKASPADLNGDGEVNGADLAILLGDWGDC
ncbi:MAG: dockerin type I domain-containing protein [Phycisphaerales bacterium]